jgi:hypothetical protein
LRTTGYKLVAKRATEVRKVKRRMMEKSCHLMNGTSRSCLNLDKEKLTMFQRLNRDYMRSDRISTIDWSQRN